MQRKFIEIMLHHENQNKLLVYFIVDNIALLCKNKHFAHISSFQAVDIEFKQEEMYVIQK